MISCEKCGFGHLTFEEKRACKSWSEKVADCVKSGHLIVHRNWHHYGPTTMESCNCGENRVPWREAPDGDYLWGTPAGTP